MSERAHQDVIVQDALHARRVGKDRIQVADAGATGPYGPVALRFRGVCDGQLRGFAAGAFQGNSDRIQNADLGLLDHVRRQVLKAKLGTEIRQCASQTHEGFPLMLVASRAHVQPYDCSTAFN